MDCTLATLIACFHMSNLYVDTGLLAQDASFPHMETHTHVNTLPGAIETVTEREMTMRSANPYGRLAIGYGIDFRSVSLSMELAHVSSLATDSDRGVNSLQLRARWYPLR